LVTYKINVYGSSSPDVFHDHHQSLHAQKTITKQQKMKQQGTKGYVMNLLNFIKSDAT